MSDFTPITTQEELNKVIGERVAKAKETAKEEIEKKYADYASFKTKAEESDATIANLKKELETTTKKSSGFEAKIQELTGKVQKYETDSVKTRIAHECGLPFGMASRLQGSTEEEIQKDAQAMRKLLGDQQPKAPGKDNDFDSKKKPGDVDMREGLRDMLQTLKGE